MQQQTSIVASSRHLCVCRATGNCWLMLVLSSWRFFVVYCPIVFVVSLQMATGVHAASGAMGTDESGCAMAHDKNLKKVVKSTIDADKTLFVRFFLTSWSWWQKQQPTWKSVVNAMADNEAVEFVEVPFLLLVLQQCSLAFWYSLKIIFFLCSCYYDRWIAEILVLRRSVKNIKRARAVGQLSNTSTKIVV